MKKPFQYFRGLEGTIMIFSLFVILGGTLVLAAWVQMLATRATYSAMTEEGVKRRIALENGRALARQYVLNQMPLGYLTYTNCTNYLANGCGGFQINAAASLWTNTNLTIGNPFNVFSDDSFVSTNVRGTIYGTNSSDSFGWTFLIRTRSPLLAGYPLAVHNPGSTNLTSVVTNAYKIYWTSAMGFSNAADIPFTSGYTSSDTGATNAYIGYFASPMNTSYPYTDATGLTTNEPINATPTTSVTNGTNITSNYTGGTTTITINSTQTNDITRYVVTNTVSYSTNFPSTTNRIYKNYSNATVTNLVLVGSTSTNALHVIANSTNLNTITLNGTANSRRIYISKTGGNLALKTSTTTGNYTWWLGMTLSGCNATVTAPSSTKSLTLTNGIRTDGTIGNGTSTSSANFIVVPNSLPGITGTNISPIELIPDRIMWLEEQKTP